MQARRAVLVALLALFSFCLPSFAAEKQRLRVDDYLIDAEIIPKAHRLVARARVKFTALDDIATATFDLHNGLAVKRVVDEAGHQLSAERVTQDSTVRVALPNGLAKGSSSTLTFDYEGTLLSGDDSPVPGLKLAYVGEDETYLLYAGRWFPVAGYGTNRFTATINVYAPPTWSVIGSGPEKIGSPARAMLSSTRNTIAAEVPGSSTTLIAQATKPKTSSRSRRSTAKSSEAEEKPAEKHTTVPAFTPTPGSKVFTYTYDKPSFPGTIIAVPYQGQKVAGGVDLTVYFAPAKKAMVNAYAESADKSFAFFTTTYGPLPSPQLKLVQLPDDTVPSAWAPGIAAIASRAIQEKVNYRLLANAIAHQWWGASVSPATRDDWWLSDGFARYSEARYVEYLAGPSGYTEAVKDMEVGALAYDTVPLSRVSSLDTFSPEFQSMVTDKGAVILHMLRWVIGDAAFDKTMRAFYQQFAGKPATVDDFEKVASQNYGENINWFFAQWLDSTGAPEFKTKYTVYRTAKGFRVVGEISQDLDLFRMPVELKIDTDGKTEMKRIDVVGTNSAFQVETFGKPRRITVDPDNRVLQNSPDLKVRTAIMRGQQLTAQNDLTGALREFQKALDSNHNSSLAHYRIAEVFFLQRNYQSAANAYREALNGDGEPKWTEVWSHVQLGKIFDLTGQRERAVNEYRQAVQTNDNTQGAIDEARRYLQQPFAREKAKEGLQ
jgi:tetratricopeptide (TPR) repeat protein